MQFITQDGKNGAEPVDLNALVTHAQKVIPKTVECFIYKGRVTDVERKQAHDFFAITPVDADELFQHTVVRMLTDGTINYEDTSPHIFEVVALVYDLHTLELLEEVDAEIEGVALQPTADTSKLN
jgi:hypothetical protein